MNDKEREMVEAINAARAARGAGPLRADERLAAAARGHAADLAAHPGLMHTGSDGSSIGQRVAESGYVALAYSEVVGWGWGGAIPPMVDWWLNSAAHVGLVLDAEMVDVGVGYAVGLGPWGHYWCVDFGRPLAEENPAPPGVEPPPPPPHVVYAPIVVGGAVSAGIDLLDYLRGDGRAYRVGNQRGTFEVFQTQDEGGRFYQVKAWDDLSVVNWEEFVVSERAIGRDVDTSPGGGRFYTQLGAPWVARRMRVGERFSQAKQVQFYTLEDCRPSAANSGTVTDTITLVEQLAEWRSVFGVELRDVIRLRWEQGGEDYWYARGLGLVAWRRVHNDQNSPEWSAIAEMRPEVGKLARLRIPCLGR